MARQFYFAACTDKGLVRDNNEDDYRVVAPAGLAVVADGMGGHHGGEIASSLAVEAVEFYLQDHPHTDDDKMQALLTVGSAVELANQRIRQEARDNPSLKGMGTTIVVTLFQNDHLYYAHVGDSRLYRFANDRLVQLTRDHSLVQMLIDRGTYANVWQAQSAGVSMSMLTRGLGVEDQVEVDVSDVTVAENAIYLLCTDGLTSMLSDVKIEDIIRKNRNDLEAAAEVLVAESLAAGGLDNVTVVLATSAD